MKPGRLLVLLLACLAFPATGQTPAKLAVFVSAQTPDPVGQQLVQALRERVRRSPGLALAPAPDRATLILTFVSMASRQDSPAQETAYSVALAVNDDAAFTGASYWSSMVGICGADRPPACAETVGALLDRAAGEFRSEMQRRAARLQLEKTK